MQAAFSQAAFVADVGIRLRDAGPGWCETDLDLLPRHMQQDGVVHAGVQATMADHTAGAAAGTLVAENELVLTVEFKINLLRPARGERLHCRAQVLKAGKTLTVAESEVYCYTQEQPTLVSKATVTLAVIERR
jgi:uncharacterized protein (TIGR00369 family)